MLTRQILRDSSPAGPVDSSFREVFLNPRPISPLSSSDIDASIIISARDNTESMYNVVSENRKGAVLERTRAISLAHFSLIIISIPRTNVLRGDRGAIFEILAVARRETLRLSLRFARCASRKTETQQWVAAREDNQLCYNRNVLLLLREREERQRGLSLSLSLPRNNCARSLTFILSFIPQKKSDKRTARACPAVFAAAHGYSLSARKF